ncbi:MAG TPA: hypothetical protein VM324_00330 [Egibacteraceae bacterium]|nr:hypothetical protein [Egibacteraceae bacterium]
MREKVSGDRRRVEQGRGRTERPPTSTSGGGAFDLVLRLQRAAGNRAVATVLGNRTVQRTSINPALFFGAAAPRPDTTVRAAIGANTLGGFGSKVNNALWHTKLTYLPLRTPGAHPSGTMNPEGAGVQGVIGPDHPYGSQPSSPTAAQNNIIAGNIRGWVPHGHVAAHIVNDQLGGPGEQQNLFAFPGTANTLMETQVEGKMKEAVADGHYIYYRADVNHPASGPADSITMTWNKLDAAGNDIGGGQSNVVITAANTAANTAMGLPAGAPARTMSLKRPTNPQVIKATPWGPFQMPDPKNAIALGQFLDTSEFPAVGTKEAFVGFLETYRNSADMLDLMVSSLNDHTLLRTLGEWIRSPKSTITIKANRGVTKEIVSDLRTGTSSEKKDAFVALMATGDAGKVMGAAASLFAKRARANARSLV